VELVIQNIEKKYGAKKVLSNLSFKCKKGEVIGLLGLNGAGKTSLMKVLTGFNLNWTGNISLNGIDLKKRLKDVQQLTGYLPENNPLYEDLLVIEYLKLTSKLYRVKNPDINKIIHSTGLSNYKHHKIGKLSKGYKQRVGLAASIIHKPELLILDEPMTGLDPKQILEIRKLIKELGKKKIIILSSHILNEVESLCSRIILIHEGKLILDSSIKKLKLNKKNISLEKIFNKLTNSN
tara:strand:- start:1721 stop:2428 length:708 start_codon:yes stop_codon:yes gene_type:complete